MWLRRHLSELRPRAALHAVRFGAVAWALAPMVEASLGAVGLKRTIGWLERLTARGGRGPEAVDLDLGERVVRRAFRAHIGLRGLCLERALVQWAAHRLEGTPARFVIGLRDGARHTGEDGVQAHAWVELGNDESTSPRAHAPKTTDTGERYVPLERSGLRKARLGGIRGAA